jgi:hypothetical protein
MKDVFYTLLVVWVIWKIVDGLNASRLRSRNSHVSSNERYGETTVSYAPPTEKTKKKFPDDGEYVDYEEVK